MTIDILNTRYTAEEEATKLEHTYLASPFNTTTTFKDLPALALKLQDLLLMEPGTNPSAVEMGVGIRNYLMDFLDEATIGEITTRVNQQVRRYLPNPEIDSIRFRSGNKQHDRNSLYMFVHLRNVDEEFETKTFALEFGIDSNDKNKLVAKAYV